MSQTLEQYRIQESIDALTLKHGTSAAAAISYLRRASYAIGTIRENPVDPVAEADICRNCGHGLHIAWCSAAYCECTSYAPSETQI